MSEVIRGYVRKIVKKEGTGKRGPWTLTSVKLTNEDGSAEREPWYSAGFKGVPFAEGDYVEVTIKPSSRDGYFDLDAASAKKIAPPAKQQAAAAVASLATATMPATTKDKNINLQSARSAAIELVRLQIDKGGLALPKKTPDIYAVIRSAVDKETVQFYHDAMTGRLLESVADAGALEEPPGSEDGAGDSEDNVDG